MKFNSNKCKILYVGENNPAVSYYMDASALESSGVEKDLGVLVDNKLKFDQHINETVKQSNRLPSLKTLSAIGTLISSFSQIDWLV